MNEELYFKLFNKISDIIEQLQALQIEMEDVYIGSEKQN